MSRAIRRYHTGACERKIASIRACPEPSVPLRKKPIVAVSPKIVRIFTQSGIFLSFLFIRELNALYRFVNTMEIPPTATPIIIASQKKLTGSAVGAGISKSLGERLRLGKSLQSPVVVRVAEIVAIDADINMIGEKRRCASSMAKNMPVRGAPVAEAKPAHAPPVMVYRSHALCFFAKRFVVPFPIEHPICTLGPSEPRGIPTRKESRFDVNIPSRLDIHLNGIKPLKIASEFGIPLPRTIGSSFITT